MRSYFLITGILSILYYLMLVFYSGRLRTTFAPFWVFFGGAHLILGCAPFPISVYTVLEIICIAGWICFIGIESMIIKAMFSTCDRPVDYIIILGAQVRGRRITDSLKRRVDKGAVYLQQYPRTKVIVSGGQGPGEDISEADAMTEYLVSCGITPDRICIENRSTSTRENFAFSRKYFNPGVSSVAIVTNGFHMYRAALIAKQEGCRNVYLLPASSNPVFQLNYMMREFFAVIHILIKKYILKKRGK